MTLVVAPLLLSLTLAAGLEQTKPEFSGKWTKIDNPEEFNRAVMGFIGRHATQRR